ncbi:MAG: hypothetical protein ABWX67_10385, partial [Allosphingosinicella sp.]
MKFRPGKVFTTLSCALLAGGSQPPPVPAPPQTPRVHSSKLREEAPAAYATALDTDCSHAEPSGAGYQFIATCPGKAVSPDGKWAIVTSAGEESGARLEDAGGKLEDELTALSDSMPFVVYWSPRSNWFFVNHYLGSGQDRLRVFEIVNRTAIERSSVFASATRVAVARYPCLGHHAAVVASGWRWSRDGGRIAMAVYARPDACHVEGPPNEWHPLGEWEGL